MRLRRPFLLACLCFLAANPARTQPSSPAATPSSAVADAAKLCANPYGNINATGWPEGPVYILYHRKDSPRTWAHNPAILAPGLEASSPATARTLVCVEETLEEKGEYVSGEAAYQAHWSSTIVSLAGRAAYRGISAPEFDGDVPPYLKYKSGPGIGKLPLQPFLRWLQLLVDEKVAHFKMRLNWPDSAYGSDYANVSAMAVSQDGSKFVAARQSRSGGSSPIVVFDLASGKPLATLRRDYTPRHIAISGSGNLIATEGMFSHGIDIMDVTTGNPVHKIDAATVETLQFGPGDTLAVSGDSKVVLWDIATEHPIRSVPGAKAIFSPGRGWLLATRSASSLAVNEIDTGRAVAAFPNVGLPPEDKYVLSLDGTALTELQNGDATLFTSESANGTSLTLPSILMDSATIQATRAIAPTKDGIVFAGQGFVGIASRASPSPHYFANGDSYIEKLAVSPGGNLLILESIEGELYLWELL